MSTNTQYVVVIGGLNIDIAGLSGPVYHVKDSNPGQIRLSTGGVGCNIASNLAKLGVPVYLVSACGEDRFGAIAYDSCRQIGIDMSGCARLPGQTTSTYLYINDNHGDLVSAVNDMRITEQITPAFLSERMDLIGGASLIVLDANIPQAAIEWLCGHTDAPIFADPVSVAKAGRFKHVLNRIDTFKPNELEAGYLTGIPITDGASARAAGGKLNQMGIRHVFISMGAQGMLYASAGAGAACGDARRAEPDSGEGSAAREAERRPAQEGLAKKEQPGKISACQTAGHSGAGSSDTGMVPPRATRIVSTNGAGDCAMAAIIWCRLRYGEKISPRQVCLCAQTAAAINMRSPFSIAPDLSGEELRRGMGELR